MSEWESSPEKLEKLSLGEKEVIEEKDVGVENDVVDEKENVVLKERTNINDGIKSASEVGTFDPQARGWVKPARYDYEVYNNHVFATEQETTGEANTVTPGLPSAQWAATAERYEWLEEYGDVAPRNESLEKILFQNEFRTRLGPSITK